MKRVHLVIGAVAAAGLSGCVAGPARSANPLGNNDPHRDLATSEQFPLRSDPTKEEVDRQFEQQYPGTVSWLYVWGKDRWFDLMDIVSWDIAFGRGLGFNVHATELLQVGLNWWDGTSWGQRGRAWGVWETSEFDRGFGPLYWVELERSPKWGTQTLWDHEYKFTGWDYDEASLESGNKALDHDWSEFGGKVHVIAVGADASVSPIEAIDFVAGLFPVGLIANVFGYHHPVFDIVNDDTHAEIERKMREENSLGQ